MEPHDETTQADVSSDVSSDRSATPASGASDGAPAPAPEPASDDHHVAAALRELDEVADRPLAEHPDVFGRVHSRLQQALADIDDA